MLEMPIRFPALWIAATMALAVTVPARAQQPTEEQRRAIRSSCRSDYMAHCASVPPGGLASLQCLQQNMANLSAACKSAVNAVTPSSTPPKAESAPAAPKAESKAESKIEPKVETKPEPKSASAPPASKAETAPAVTKPAAPAPKAGGAKPSSAGTPAKPATTTATPDIPPPVPALVLRPMRPLEELAVLRSACGVDARVLCGNVPPGGGRIIQCLASQPASLSPGCTDVLGQFAAQ